MQEQDILHTINLAHAANQQSKFTEAKKLCRQVLRYAPDIAEAWYNQGLALSGLGIRAEALRSFEQARQRTLQSADAQNAIGLALLEMDAEQAAEKCLLRAISLAPGYALAHVNLGKLRQQQKRLQDALASCETAINLEPALAPAYANMGGILNTLKRHAEAEQVCRKAITLDSNLAAGWNNLCVALFGLKQYKAAESICRKTIELTPDSADAWVNLGEILSELKDHLSAADCFQQALHLKSDIPFLHSQLLSQWMQVCHWDNLHKELPTLLKTVERKSCGPFIILGLADQPRLHRIAAEVYSQAEYPESTALPALPRLPKREKIRIGYYSADFHNHAVSYLMAELFELHNRDEFEIIGFSFGPDKMDEMRQRVSKAFDQFHDVRTNTDTAIATLSRELGIDIAIDLTGYTRNSRPGIFACHAAPIQVNYLGFSSTMGCPYIDYLIADPILIPKASQQYYSEKIVYLPHSFQVNDRHRPIADITYTRTELHLPEKAFIFCCFNNSYKITPSTFAGWMRILQQVEGSVLWLSEANPAANDNLRKSAQQYQISAERLIFAPKFPLLENHLARYRAADLFLDTLPYNAHTTASDALWAGLPVLTCAGNSFASRVAASLLNAIHLPELITTNQTDYEKLAIQLAHNPQQLLHIREKLAQNRLTTPLFDSGLFTRHMEAAYKVMHERYHQGLPPEYIEVEP